MFISRNTVRFLMLLIFLLLSRKIPLLRLLVLQLEVISTKVEIREKSTSTMISMNRLYPIQLLFMMSVFSSNFTSRKMLFSISGTRSPIIIFPTILRLQENMNL